MINRKQLTELDRARQTISRLQNENIKLRQENQELRKQLLETQELLINAIARIKDLEEMIFGRKNRGNKNNQSHGCFGKPNNGALKKERDNDSYQRSVPDKAEITSTEHHSIDNCPDCHRPLRNKRTLVRYLEDINLSVLDRLKIKVVIKQKIESGYCPHCRAWHSAIPLSRNPVSLGQKTKMFVAYTNYVLRLSYQQITDILHDLYGMKISKGEITNILDLTADKLNPEFQRLLTRVKKSQSAHLDETGWQTGREKNFAWTMASGDSEEAVFLIGQSRGKGNAEKLLNGFNGVRITDCYSAYKNLVGPHQVCWVHLLRKFRDLLQNSSTPEVARKLTETAYDDLMNLYLKLKTVLGTTFNLAKRKRQFKKMVNELCKIANAITNASLKKLMRLKEQILNYQNQFLTCLVYPNVAPENNKAERKLRQLVLKRKTSFGTKTKKGNESFHINFSVLMSLWWQNRAGFFSKFSDLLQ